MRESHHRPRFPRSNWLLSHVKIKKKVKHICLFISTPLRREAVEKCDPTREGTRVDRCHISSPPPRGRSRNRTPPPPLVPLPKTGRKNKTTFKNSIPIGGKGGNLRFRRTSLPDRRHRRRPLPPFPALCFSTLYGQDGIQPPPVPNEDPPPPAACCCCCCCIIHSHICCCCCCCCCIWAAAAAAICAAAKLGLSMPACPSC